jgi:hypothetical protein
MTHGKPLDQDTTFEMMAGSLRDPEPIIRNHGLLLHQLKRSDWDASLIEAALQNFMKRRVALPPSVKMSDEWPHTGSLVSDVYAVFEVESANHRDLSCATNQACVQGCIALKYAQLNGWHGRALPVIGSVGPMVELSVLRMMPPGCQYKVECKSRSSGTTLFVQEPEFELFPIKTFNLYDTNSLWEFGMALANLPRFYTKYQGKYGMLFAVVVVWHSHQFDSQTLLVAVFLVCLSMQTTIT